jgi:hypothetical protein
MKAVIPIDNFGNPSGPPTYLLNLINLNPDFDISEDIAPDGYAWFAYNDHRTSIPGMISILKCLEYRIVPSQNFSGFEQEWYLRDKTEEELERLKKDFQNNPVLPGWVFDENTYHWIPPTPKPNDNYRWDISTSSWLEIGENEASTPPFIPSALTPNGAKINLPGSNRTVTYNYTTDNT